MDAQQADRLSSDVNATPQETPPASPQSASPQPLDIAVQQNLEHYFAMIDGVAGAAPHAIYDMVIGAVEKPMLAFVMNKAGGNQSVAARLLGINRNTLRKKLLEHGLLSE